MTRLRDKYQKDVVPALQKEFGYKNVMAVPKIEKVVVNMGLGEATSNAKIVDTGADELARITGQKPVTRRAKKSIAAFKVRRGMPIATMVTLRGERMWEFLDRLMSIALPRVRDFKGISPRGFDGRGNYTLGLRDQLMFPEIDYMKVDKARGMNVSVVTTVDGTLLASYTGVRSRLALPHWLKPDKTHVKIDMLTDLAEARLNIHHAQVTLLPSSSTSPEPYIFSSCRSSCFVDSSGAPVCAPAVCVAASRTTPRRLDRVPNIRS